MIRKERFYPEQKETKINPQERAKLAGWILRMVAESGLKREELSPSQSDITGKKGALMSLLPALKERNPFFARFVNTVKSTDYYKEAKYKDNHLDYALRDITPNIGRDAIELNFGRNGSGKLEQERISLWDLDELSKVLQKYRKEFEKEGIGYPQGYDVVEELLATADGYYKKSGEEHREVFFNKVSPEDLGKFLKFYSKAQLAFLQYGAKLSEIPAVSRKRDEFLRDVSFLQLTKTGGPPISNILRYKERLWKSFLSGYNELDGNPVYQEVREIRGEE